MVSILTLTSLSLPSSLTTDSFINCWAPEIEEHDELTISFGDQELDNKGELLTTCWEEEVVNHNELHKLLWEQETVEHLEFTQKLRNKELVENLADTTSQVDQLQQNLFENKKKKKLETQPIGRGHAQEF